MIPLGHYLIVSAMLFAIGTAGVFLRRNLITILLSIEIMLNAVNLSFVAFGRALGQVDGQILTFFVITGPVRPPWRTRIPSTPSSSVMSAIALAS